MPPAERERALAQLPPDRQEKVRQQLQRYDQMPPERKAQLQRLWDLPADKQQKVRQSMRELGQQPVERRRAMWQQLQHMNQMTHDERKHYFKSEDFKGQFTKPEQEIMKNMSEILPSS